MKFGALVIAIASLTDAQHVTVPATCTDDFQPGTSVVIYTVPYTYDQVMSVIGSYKNLTWSGNKPSTVKLNGTDNKVGTARSYTIPGLGAHLIETITKYSKPPHGPYQEIHTTALFTLPSVKLKAYIPYDGTIVSEMCGGRAARFNFTAHFCANNATVGKKALDEAHMTDAVTVGKFLGGQNFTSCSALSKKQGSQSNTPGSRADAPLPMLAATIAVTAATFIAAMFLL